MHRRHEHPRSLRKLNGNSRLPIQPKSRTVIVSAAVVRQRLKPAAKHATSQARLHAILENSVAVLPNAAMAVPRKRRCSSLELGEAGEIHSCRAFMTDPPPFLSLLVLLCQAVSKRFRRAHQLLQAAIEPPPPRGDEEEEGPQIGRA